MKKWTIRVLLCAVLVGLLCLTAAAANVTVSGFCGGEGDGSNLTWTLYDDGLLHIDGSGAMGEWSITERTLPWIDHRTEIKRVVIGDGVTSIGMESFFYCNNLAEISMGSGVQSIGKMAFYACRKLEAVTFPEGLLSIADQAFCMCAGLTSVKIPDSVTIIGSEAFDSCRSLSDLTIGSGVTSIGDSAFFYNVPLRNVYYTGDMAGWCRITFLGSTANPARQAENLYIGGELVSGTLVIPDGVTSIGNYAFQRRSDLTGLVLPDSLTVIGDYAFSNCENLTYVNLGDGVTDIGDWAFYSCTGLTEITIGDSVLGIGERAFAACRGLTTVTIGSGLKSVGDGAFYGVYGVTDVYYTGDVAGWCGISFQDSNPMQEASNLYIGGERPSGKLVIPGGVTKIPAYAFKGCDEITAVSLPSSLVGIGDGAFSGCTNLTKVDIPDDVTSVGQSAFSNCSALTEVTIGKRVTDIGGGAFYSCDALNKVTLPGSVKTIGVQAFCGCYNLENVYYTGNVAGWCGIAFGGNDAKPDGDNLYIGGKRVSGTLVIPDGVTKIGAYAFQNCYSLSGVKLPESLTEIGDYAFDYCPKLTEADIPDRVTKVGNYAFDQCNLEKLTLGDGLTEIGDCAFASNRMRSVQIPKRVTSIGEGAFMSCSLDRIEVAEENTVYCDVDGVLFTKDLRTLLLCPQYRYEAYVIPDGVTTIENRAFFGCHYLPVVDVPSTVTRIGDYAFRSCDALEKVRFAGNGPEIGEAPFDSRVTLYYDPYTSGWVDSPAYDAAENTWHGYKLKSWRPLKDYNVEPLHTGTLELYADSGKAYYRLFDKSEKAVTGQRVNYTFGVRTQSAITDGNGVFAVEIPKTSGKKEYSLTFSSPDVMKEIQGDVQTLTVKGGCVSYEQEWSGSLGAGIGASLGGGAGVGVGVATFEATAAKASAKAGVNGQYALKDSYENGVRTMEATYTYDTSAGIEFKSGVDATVPKTKIKVASVSAGANYTQQASSGMKIKGYDPGNMEHLMKFGKFNLQVSLMGVNSVWAQRILDWLDVGAHNQSAYNSMVALEAGASIGMIEVEEDEEIGIAGGAAALVVSSGRTTDYLEKEKTQTAKIVTDYGAGILANIGDVIPGAGDYLYGNKNSNSWEMLMKYNWKDELQEIAYKVYEEGEKNISWFGKAEEDSATLSFAKEQAEGIVEDDWVLRRYAAGKRLMLTPVDLWTSLDTATTGDYTAKTEYTHTVKEGIDIDLPFELEMIAGGELSLKGSFIDAFSYKTGAGVFHHGEEYFTSVSDKSKSEMLKNRRSLIDVLTEPIAAIADMLKEYLVAVGDKIKEGVTNAYTTVAGEVEDWYADVSSAISGWSPFRSYAIMALQSEDTPETDAAVAVTVGDPYTIAVYTDATRQTPVSDAQLAANPLTITMAYTAEMLEAAGVTANADIHIYRFDYEHNMYILVANCVQDRENMTVTASIARQGEYILATDNASPLVSDFAVSDGTANPTITVLVSDLSGIGEFAFWLDDGSVLVDSVGFAGCYDSTTGLFTYKVTQPLSAGEHTAYFRAADTLGNANAEPFSFSFTVDASAPVIGDVSVPDWLVTDGYSFDVFATVTDDNALSRVMTRITLNDRVTTLNMDCDGDMWYKTAEDLTGTGRATVEIIAVDMAGNRSQSQPFFVDVDIPERPTGLQIEAERSGASAEVNVYNYQQAVGGWMISAVYDADGKMLDMSSQYIGLQKNEKKFMMFAFDCSEEEIAYGKVFFLDVSADYAAMLPVCEFY